MEEQTFKDVWYYSYHFMNNKMYTSFKGKYEDRGVLAISGQALIFSGLDEARRIENIQEISIEKRPDPTFRRFSMGFVGLQLLAAGFLFLSLGILQNAESPMFSAVVGFAMIVFGFFRIWYVYAATPWIAIRYNNTKDEPYQIYLADGRLFGRLGVMGGTKKLYRVLEEIYR